MEHVLGYVALAAGLIIGLGSHIAISAVRALRGAACRITGLNREDSRQHTTAGSVCRHGHRKPRCAALRRLSRRLLTMNLTS